MGGRVADPGSLSGRASTADAERRLILPVGVAVGGCQEGSVTSAPAGHIDVDGSGLPLLFVRFVGTVTDKQFRDYLDQLTRWVGTGRRVVVVDASCCGRISPSQRRMQIAWVRQHRVMLGREILGIAFVISSPLVRGALTSILWAAPLPGEQVVVPSLPEALDWATSLLQATGVGRSNTA